MKISLSSYQGAPKEVIDSIHILLQSNLKLQQLWNCNPVAAIIFFETFIEFHTYSKPIFEHI